MFLGNLYQTNACQHQTGPKVPRRGHCGGCWLQEAGRCLIFTNRYCADRHGWPTVVVEVGLSESCRKLEEDVKWWLTESEGRVQTAVAVSIETRGVPQLTVERWEMPTGTDTGTGVPVKASSVTTVQ